MLPVFDRVIAIKLVRLSMNCWSTLYDPKCALVERMRCALPVSGATPPQASVKVDSLQRRCSSVCGIRGQNANLLRGHGFTTGASS